MNCLDRSLTLTKREKSLRIFFFQVTFGRDKSTVSGRPLPAPESPSVPCGVGKTDASNQRI